MVPGRGPADGRVGGPGQGSDYQFIAQQTVSVIGKGNGLKEQNYCNFPVFATSNQFANVTVSVRF